MDNPIKMKHVKYATSVVVGHCVKTVVATAITNLVPTETKAQKAQVFVGTYVLSSMVAAEAKTYVYNQLSEYSDSFKKMKSETPVK